MDEKTVETIREIKRLAKERDAKHAAIIRKATHEIIALKNQLSGYKAKNDNGQLVVVVSKLQNQILKIHDDIDDLTQELNKLSKKLEPKEEETKDAQHVETDKVGDITYVGKAKPDSSFDKPVWCIQKVTKNGNKTKVEIAENEAWSKRKEVEYA